MPLLLPGSTQVPGGALNLPRGRRPRVDSRLMETGPAAQSSPTLRECTHTIHISPVCAWQEGWAQRL